MRTKGTNPWTSTEHKAGRKELSINVATDITTTSHVIATIDVSDFKPLKICDNRDV